jgi:hypothetical protein
MISRRDSLLALAGMAALPLLDRPEIERLIALGHRALTPAQHELVSLAAERIIPRTTTPGATDVHVADFIDVMLADWYTPRERDVFLAGIDALGTRGFAKTAAVQQTAMLEAAEQQGQGWFTTLKHLTVHGYCTSRPGIVEELRVDLMPGRYDGNAPY